MVNAINRILKILIEKSESNWNIRKLSIEARINYKSSYQAVKKLKDLQLIEEIKIGNTNLCKFTGKYHPLIYEVEYERLNEILENKSILNIYNTLNKINAQFIGILFGSYAKKTANKSSDIDLLIITEDPQIELIISTIHKVHATIISTKEFIEMIMSKEFTVVSEALKNNIPLIGIEDYYRLKNVEKIFIRRTSKKSSNRT